jgi:GNAT superfamily N-acetyltransferase
LEGARAATPDDAPQVARLCSQAREELEPLRGGRLLLATRVERTDGCVIVGTVDDVVVGWTRAGIDDLADGTRLGVIQDLYVEEGARGVGVGEAMLEHLLAWFAEQGCDGADAYALPGTRDTKNFFEGSGFSARLLVMHRSLAPR